MKENVSGWFFSEHSVEETKCKISVWFPAGLVPPSSDIHSNECY